MSRWIFLRKYLPVFTRYLLLRKAPSEILHRVINTPLEYVHFVYIVWDQFLTVIWLKGFYRRFEWILEFGKVGLSLNYIKRFRLYFHYFWNCWRLVRELRKSFILYQLKHTFHYCLAKQWGCYCHLGTHRVVEPACIV